MATQHTTSTRTCTSLLFFTAAAAAVVAARQEGESGRKAVAATQRPLDLKNAALTIFRIILYCSLVSAQLIVITSLLGH